MSETDNFIRIEMTAVESAVEVIEGETLLWKEFLYSLCEDPSLNSAFKKQQPRGSYVKNARPAVPSSVPAGDAAGENADSSLQPFCTLRVYLHKEWQATMPSRTGVGLWRFLLYGCLQLATWLSLAALFPAQVAAGCWTLIPEGRGPSISEV